MATNPYIPQVNETTAPYQFDGQVTIGGANAAQSMSPGSPAQSGLKAWTFPTYMASGTGTFSLTGSVYLAQVNLPANTIYSNIWTYVLATGGTATAGSCFAGLYNSAGSLVATTADISGVLGTAAGTTGYLSFPLSTAYTTPAGGNYFLGMFFNASGTASMPVLASIAGQTVSNGSLLARDPGGAPFTFSTIATTSATQMPQTFALGSAGTTNASCFWAGLS